VPKAALTARNIFRSEELPPPAKGRVEYLDPKTPGLALRVTSKNHRSWCLVYRFKGTPRRYTLGDLTEKHGLVWAREQAEEQVFKPVSRGTDPATAKSQERKAETFKQLAELYLKEHAKARKRSWKTDKNIIHKDLIPRFGSSKAGDVTRRDIKAMLAAIRERGAPIQANRTLEVARKMFNWAIGEDLVEHNPCDHIAKPSPERQRERKLSDDEIRAIWNALPSIDPIIAATYRVRFRTGVRGNEALDMERTEIDGDWWTIPGLRSKNGRAHRVPLTAAALAIIAEMEPHNKGRKRIFPGRGKTGLTYAIYDAQRELIEASGVPDWTPHDIRRTVASNLGSLGFSRFIIGRILNHVDPSVTKIYDQHTYDTEKRQALEAWGATLEEILSGKRQPDNVVPMAPRTA
jgi:integrase